MLTGFWHVPRASFGPVFSAGLVGLMLGAMVFTPVADRYGTRRVLLACTGVYALLTLATALAPSREMLLALRFLTGLGLGGAMPNAIALVSEYSPTRVRTLMVAAAVCGFSLGGPVGMGLAIKLGQRGIRCDVVERYAQPQPIPKGQNLTQRTMEHFHFWGTEHELRAARTIPREYGIGGLTARGTTEELAADFAGWHGDVQTLIHAIGTPCKRALMLRRPVQRWTSGRVTLLGDACHPTLPMLAQGAVQTIEDGYLLGRALAESGGVEEGLPRYEAARQDRTARVVLGSAENARRPQPRAGRPRRRPGLRGRRVGREPRAQALRLAVPLRGGHGARLTAAAATKPNGRTVPWF